LKGLAVDRLDRTAVIALALIAALGFAIWQVASSLSYVATELLVHWWEDGGDSSFDASFSIGGVDIDYGQVLASLITLLIALAVAIPLLRYAQRRRTAAPTT
jgi:hypothetical protein